MKPTWPPVRGFPAISARWLPPATGRHQTGTPDRHPRAAAVARQRRNEVRWRGFDEFTERSKFLVATAAVILLCSMSYFGKKFRAIPGPDEFRAFASGRSEAKSRCAWYTVGIIGAAELGAAVPISGEFGGVVLWFI
jgi:hypothetical protein